MAANGEGEPSTADYQQYNQELHTIPSRPHHGGEEPPRYHDVTSPNKHQTSGVPVVAGGDDIDGRHRRLSIDEDSETSSINEEYEIASITSSIEDQLTWRGRMRVILHSHYFHYFIVGLVVLDAFIVLFELLLDVGAFRNIRCEGETRVAQQEFCHYSDRFRLFCSPPARLILEGISISPEGTANDPNYQPCRCGFRDGNRVCINANEGTGVNPAVVLHYASLAILSIFMVEIFLKIVAFGLKYFTHKFEVFDGIVVVVSWVLDVASIVEEEAFEAAAGLIIILRLWRVVRIVNGAVLSSKAESDNHLSHARQEARRVIHAFHKSQDKVQLYEKENLRLRTSLKQAGIDIPEMNGTSDNPPLPAKKSGTEFGIDAREE